MGMFIPDDPYINENERQTGFYRYRQLLNTRFGQWWKINLLTLAGFTPLAAGIFCAVASSSVLVLLPCSLAGGMIAGPFLAGMFDALLRGLRSDSKPWWDCYKRSWRQNWRGSLIPGALTGLMLGLYAFLGLLFWTAETPPSSRTGTLCLASLLLVTAVSLVYWPQLVLFRQRAGVRVRNCLLFCIRYFWRVTGVGALFVGYWALILLFAPWTLVLLLITGIWYILFLAEFLLYEQMDASFRIEELYGGAG